ncbi:MAG: IS256 family transposase [Candidatus Aminicenantes bacterium]|nr:IS256 family transposase [Candidatus Aminicenantes bacterium]
MYDKKTLKNEGVWRMLNFVKIPCKKNNKGGTRHMKDFTAKFEESLPENFFKTTFQDLARKGAELMLRLALETEIKDFIEGHCAKKMPDGRQRIVRNGYHPERRIQTGIGDVSVKVPRSRDQEWTDDNKEQILYQSQMIPKYLRRSENIEDFLPFLYLHGVSSTRFSDVLSQLVGKPVSFSPGSLNRLKEAWEQEYQKWKCQDMTKKRYVYWWVDGIYFNIRLKEEKSCVFVILGATADGQKELVAMDIGYRESEMTWHDILIDLKQRGLSVGPSLAIGDGALGFWNALEKEYPSTVQQRCWVHRTRNILDKLPKSLQSQAKKDIHEIYQSPTKQDALKAFDRFVKVYEAKYPKAVACLLKTKDQTLAFYEFPAEHWRHIRSTNVIESAFSTVRLRTYKTRGCCKEESILPLVFKLVDSASQRWQKLHSSNIIPLVLKGVKYQDGVSVDKDKTEELKVA